MNNPGYPDRRPVSAANPQKPVPSGSNRLPDYRYTRQFLNSQPASGARASWGPRFVALFIDFVIVAVPFNLLGNLLWLQKGETLGNNDVVISSSFGLPVEIHNLLWIVVFGLYVTLTSLRSGATPGKRLMNLKVVTAGGAPLDPLRLFLRSTFGYLLSAVILGLGFVLAVFDKEKQALHDKIFKSYVVLADLTRL